MKNKNEPLKPLRDFARRVAHEGNVLLENKNSILPIINGKVALFGRIQKDYYKSGTGSGGLVNVTDVPSFLEAFNENPRIDVNKELVQIYDKWIAENPFNAGNGMWASEPWAQEEMEITQDLIKKIKRENETPIMIIGRTAGEDRDNHKGEGSYLLTEIEYQAIKTIKKIYGKVVVILNVGNIIDMNFIKELDVDGLLYAWHGGQDGARATVDVISGYITPSGKLPATIVKTLDNYPANKNFGNKKEVIYEEDIYVGYRFFETFYEDDVLYPFGFGLSYSTFEVNVVNHQIKDNKFKLDVEVKNTGEFIGKETVQVYFSAPQGVLGKPKIELLAFKKTKLIKPKEKEIVTIEVEMSKMASYDDFGYIQKSAYVLEKGLYSIYVGTSLRNNKLALTKVLDENIVVEKLTEAMAPIKKYKRIKPSLTKDNKYKITFEAVPQRTIDLQTRIKNNFPKSFKLNNENYTLTDVLNKKITLEEFIGSLSINDMKNISLGEGMSSPKVTAGTASAFGGVTDELLEKEIPIACCSDGPSGIRMDSGGFATSLPNGTLLASTFNPSLVKDLYELEGLEMRNYDIDIILGPGMNIQRHPLNGRNFEYFSEDPLLTGIMASAVVQGLHKSGVNGSLKHFAANNQETARTIANSIISERALREIYLKGFEIAVKEAKASVIMTAYNPINGIWTASNYDLTTTILRNEWKFEGIVMTDWWAQMNTDNDEPSKENIAVMVRAQNDLYMVVPNVLEYKNNLLEEYQKGNITLAEIQRNVHNILKFIMETPVFKRKHNIQVTSNEKKIDYWFKTNETHSKYPFINQDMLTSFENEADNNLKSKFDILENKNQITYGLITNAEQSLYTFGVKPALKVDEITDILKNVNKTNIYKLPNTNWGRIDLDLNGFVYKNQLANDSWSNIEKGSIYIYAVEPKEFGKYIVELEISANLPSIYQMPFSVYVDNINKQTLTTNGTEGNKVKITSFVIIDKTNEYISFKFHKTGLNVHSINVIKHG